MDLFASRVDFLKRLVLHLLIKLVSLHLKFSIVIKAINTDQTSVFLGPHDILSIPFIYL